LKPVYLAVAAVAGIAMSALTQCALAGGQAPAQQEQPVTEYIAYIGTYTGKGSQGIYRYKFDPSSGKLAPLGVTTGVENPSFLAVSPDHKYLYAVNEVESYHGAKTGAITAFEIGKDASLKALNQVATHGTAPCHLAIDKAGRHVAVANYSSGSIAVLGIKSDGSLADVTSFVQHQGTGPDASRQEGPHAHQVQFDAANKHVFAVDLGIDKVMVYQYDAKTGKLTPNTPPDAELEPGAGPRHLAFDHGAKHAYVVNELNSTIDVFNYAPATATFTKVQVISTLPTGFAGPNHPAEIQVSPDGNYVYASNRGNDTIAIFSIDHATGRLTAVDHQSVGGKNPRHFIIDPTGEYLLVANQDTNNVVVFGIDHTTGRLADLGIPIDVPTPVCVCFVAR
jgi:6-phosphogluconolactonase